MAKTSDFFDLNALREAPREVDIMGIYNNYRFVNVDTELCLSTVSYRCPG